MTAPTELLPCPFCGNAPKARRFVEEYEADKDGPSGEYDAHFFICCDHCGIEQREEYRHDAITAWNRRASPQPANPAQVTDAMVAGGRAVAHPDDLAVDRFAAAMKIKLAKKRSEGRGGWDNRDECTAEHLSYLLVQHIIKGDPLDVGNLAMMLHQRGDRIVIDDETRSIAAALTHPAPSGQAAAVEDWDIEATADQIARQLAAEVKSFGHTGRIHGETYNAAKAGALEAFKRVRSALASVKE
ncbi:hypothetical protein ATER59S_02392 [Aquamicrobium terrae]